MTAEYDNWRGPPETGPFVGASDPAPSHSAARATVAREGNIKQMRPDTHRHHVLGLFILYPEGITQKHAGVEAKRIFGIGRGTEAGEEVGRRRCGDLASTGLIARTPGSSTWRITERGKSVLSQLNSGQTVIL